MSASRRVTLAFGLAIVSCSADGSRDTRALDVAASGTLRGWPEATEHLTVRFDASGPTVELGAATREGLDAFWSIATTKSPRSGFFYADVFRARGEVRVAYAAHARSIADLTDFRALAFSSGPVGPVPEGGVVVLEHAATQRHLAIVLDAIEPTDPRTAGAGPYGFADVTWYLSVEGATGFAPR